MSLHNFLSAWDFPAFHWRKSWKEERDEKKKEKKKKKKKRKKSGGTICTFRTRKKWRNGGENKLTVIFFSSKIPNEPNT